MIIKDDRHLWRKTKSLKMAMAAAVSILISATGARANTLYVSNNPASGEYGSISDAYNASVTGDTILIKDGFYTGANNRNIFIHHDVTIASANGLGNVILDLSNNSGQSAFDFFGGLTSATKIQGLIIQNSTNTQGRGTISFDGFSTPVIAQCIFRNNTTQFRGGGGAITINGGSLTFTQCQFLNNSAPDGGGAAINVSSGNLTASQCLFSNNSTSDGSNTNGVGGAININSGNATATLINDVFMNNVASRNGSAIYVTSGSTTDPVIGIENCSFSNNYVPSSSPIGARASAIDGVGGNWTIRNSILYNDTSSLELGGLLTFPGVSATLTVQNCDIRGGFAGTGNIDADPLFVSGYSDLRLTALSPAINAGSSNSSSPSVDYLGVARDSHIDMGAYEFAITGTAVTLSPTSPNLAITRQVATFIDSVGSTLDPSAYSASINWGDGSTSAGTITQPGGSGTPYSIAGSHTYTTVSNSTVTVTITYNNPVGSPVSAVVQDTISVNRDPAMIVVGTFDNTTAGVNTLVSVTVKDLAGEQVNYYGKLHFTSTDPNATLPVDAMPTGGYGQYYMILRTSVSQTVTATDTANPNLTGTSIPITVYPSPLNHFSVSAPSSLIANQPFTVNVTAQDPYNNTVNYNGIVSLTTTAASNTLPPTLFLSGGTGSLPATLKSLGTQTINVSGGGSSGTSGPIQVSLGPVDHFDVTNTGTVTAGAPVSFTVNAVDAYENLISAYTGTAHFTSTDPTAVLPADTAITNGAGAVQATFSIAGPETLRARDTVNSSLTGTVTVNVQPQPVSSLTITNPSTTAVGTAFYVVVIAKDPLGNTVSGYNKTIHFTSTDPLAVLPADLVLTGGAKQISIKLRTPGSQKVTVTDTTNGSLTATTSNIAVTTTISKFVVSGPTTATAGAPATFTVTAKDSAGNIVTDYSGTVHITSTDAQAVLPADATLNNGVGTFTVTFKTATTVTITATDTVTNTIKGSSGGVVVSSAPASQFVLTVPASTTAGAAFYATITAKDAYGNLAKSYAGTVHFTSTDPLAILPADVTLTNGTKQASIKLKTKPSQTVTATDAANGITATSTAIAVN